MARCQSQSLAFDIFSVVAFSANLLRMRKRTRLVLLFGALLCFLLLGAVVLSFKHESLGNDIRIVPELSETRVLVTNIGTRVVAVSVIHQTLISNVWSPPKEELFTLPYHMLKPGDAMRMGFTNVLAPNATWRAVVLCQKWYADNPLGQFQYFIHSRITHRNRFSALDHRGPQDEFLFTDGFQYDPGGER